MSLSLINSASHIVLIVHKHPDADSLGSACAFYSYLLTMQKRITLFCATLPIEKRLTFLPWSDKISDIYPEEADCIISFDCGNFERLGIPNKNTPLISFDHHICNDGFGTFNYLNPEAMSTTEVVYDYFVANGIKINAKMALSLYAGILEDSQYFHNPGCDSKILTIASKLLSLGANHQKCIESLFQHDSLASLRLRGILMQNMQLLCDGQFAVFDISQQMFDESGATISDCKKVLHDALGMHTVRIAILQIQRINGTKISLRSKNGINVSEILNLFGGGGHRNRAGAFIDKQDFQLNRDKIYTMIQKELM